MKKLILVQAFLLTAIAVQAQAPQTIRYHIGDDPDGKLGWANPNFDDSTWPASQSSQWPIPALFSNGFKWVRTRVLVQSDAEGPLAIRLLNASFPLADEIFVNGVSVGKQGSFPPHVRSTSEAVFDLPAGLTAPGATAVVAFRVWYPPITHRESVALASAGFVLDGSRSLHEAERADHINALLWAGPELAFNLIILMLGFGLLVLWRWVGGRSLLISSGVLIGATAYFLVNALFALGVLPLTWLAFSLLVTSIQFNNMNLMIALLWSLRSPRALALKRVAYGVVVILNAADLILHLSITPSAIFEWSIRALTPAYVTFVGIVLCVSLWTLLVTRSNRYVAASIVFIAAVGLSAWLGILRGLACC